MLPTSVHSMWKLHSYQVQEVDPSVEETHVVVPPLQMQRVECDVNAIVPLIVEVQAEG